MRRTISLIILTCLILHGASRMGVVSFLYQNRHEIALRIGLITEVPIALCAGDYHAHKDLRIQQHESSENLPGNINSASEILLFIEENPLPIIPKFNLIGEQGVTLILTPKYNSPEHRIFQPPCEA